MLRMPGGDGARPVLARRIEARADVQEWAVQLCGRFAKPTVGVAIRTRGGPGAGGVPRQLRLAQVKGRYDPENTFHVNEDIRPATDRGPDERQGAASGQPRVVEGAGQGAQFGELAFTVVPVWQRVLLGAAVAQGEDEQGDQGEENDPCGHASRMRGEKPEPTSVRHVYVA